MNIYVNIGEEEYRLAFHQIPHPTPHGTKWRGSLSDVPSDPYIEFLEIDGEPQNLKISPQITTNRIVIEERILASLEKVRENKEYEDNDPSDDEHERIADGVIVDPYNPDDIKVRRDVFSISQIYEMMVKHHDIDLNPDFQRHFVWEATRKSRLIESVLLGIPLPVFYFSQDHDGMYHVVDGLQRLTTIREYMSNKFYLRNLEHLQGHCEGKYYMADAKVKEEKALDRRFQRRIEQTQLNVNVIEASSPAKVKYDIFKRINEGGKTLNQQEIRNCLAKPHVRSYMQNMTKLPAFILATGGKIGGEPGVSDQRMGAQELVLRFAGFYLNRRQKIHYAGNMNDFLDETLDLLNKMKESDLRPISEAFERSMENCYYVFGRFCFRKYLPAQLEESSKQLFNKSLYVTWSIIFEAFPQERVKSEMSFEGFAPILANTLKADQEYFNIVTNKTSDKSSLEMAFKKAEELVNRYLH